MMGRNLRRFSFWLTAIVVGLPTVAAMVFMAYMSYPVALAGPAAWRLSADDRVAYLILADQLAPTRATSDQTHQNRPIPVIVGTSEKLCRGASRDLIAALKSSGADGGLQLVPMTCGAVFTNHLFVETDGVRFIGGFSCGPLCGNGNDYQVRRFLGFSRIERVGSFVM